jgi:hypothetical protein
LPLPEADNTLASRPTIGYWNHSSWSGTAPLVMTAMPMDDVPHSIVTPSYNVTVKRNFHRFSYYTKGERGCIILGEVPIYFLTTRAGSEFTKRRGFIIPVLKNIQNGCTKNYDTQTLKVY